MTTKRTIKLLVEIETDRPLSDFDSSIRAINFAVGPERSYAVAFVGQASLGAIAPPQTMGVIVSSQASEFPSFRELTIEIDVDQGRLSPSDLRRVTLLEFSAGRMAPEGATGIRQLHRGSIVESMEPADLGAGVWTLRLRVQTDMSAQQLRDLRLIEFAQDGPSTACRAIGDRESMRLADVFAAVLLAVRVPD